ncbi:MAG: 16S rRNA (cytidine(1402)-2'-O)-methyltransferase [Pseudomonadota bacterium]
MIFQKVTLPAGLYLVATPIGTARDITLRALDTLASADVLAAEDTRSLRHLLSIHGVPVGGRPVLAYHDHSEASARARIRSLVAEGKSVVYTSEAGTPLIADPGYALVSDLQASGALVTVVPGPVAAVAALTLAGLPTDRFLFLGFPPPRQTARRTLLTEMGRVHATLVLYESPKRIEKLLEDVVHSLGAERKVAMCRELTKRFEDIRRGSAAVVLDGLRDVPARGECVLVVGPPGAPAVSVADLENALRAALRDQSVKDAAKLVSDAYDRPRREVYQMALRLSQGDKA